MRTMHGPVIRLALCPALALIILASCGESPKADPVGEEHPGRQFSAQDKAIARALSLGSRSKIQEESTPYDQAVACRVAIESIGERLRQLDTVTSDQIRAVDQAEALYDRRIQVLASAADKSNGDISADIQARAEVDTDQGAQALRAIDCLRNLEQAN